MTTLCNCKRQFIRDIVSDTILAVENRAGGYIKGDVLEIATQRTEEIAKIVESECVCKKEECDHIVGQFMEGYYDPALVQVKMSEYKKGRIKKEILRKRDNDFEFDKCCRICGFPIDWEKIRSELGTSEESNAVTN